MTFEDLKKKYERQLVITESEAIDEEIAVFIIPRAEIMPESLGVGVMTLDDGLYVFPYDYVDGDNGFEHFSIERARRLTPDLLEQVDAAIGELAETLRETRRRLTGEAKEPQ